MAMRLVRAKPLSEPMLVKLIRTLGTNFSELLSEIHTFSFKKMHLNMSPGKWRPFCLGLNELRLGRWSYERGNLVHDDVMALELFPHCCPFHWSLAYLSGVPDLFDHNKIFSGGDLSHYQVPRCIRVLFYFLWFVFIHHNFNFILNHVLIVTFWIFTYHKIWILLIIFCFIWIIELFIF